MSRQQRRRRRSWATRCSSTASYLPAVTSGYYVPGLEPDNAESLEADGLIERKPDGSLVIHNPRSAGARVGNLH
jgi:hypothetical protein